jgi:hypothetical protein
VVGGNINAGCPGTGIEFVFWNHLDVREEVGQTGLKA